MKTSETKVISAADPLSAYFNRSGQFCYLITSIYGELLFANSFFCKKINRTGSNLTDVPIIDIILPEEKSKCKAFILQCISNANNLHTTDLHLLPDDYDSLVIRWEVSVVKAEGLDQCLQWVGTVLEINRNKSALPIIEAGKKTEKYLQINQLNYREELILLEVQQQKQLIQTTIDGQEQERLHIGKELYDNISQHLNTTRLYLEVAKEKTTGEIFFMISDAHKNLTDIINEVRQLSFSLVPPALADLGLIESIKDLCGAIKEKHSFRIDFHHNSFNESGLPYNMKLMLFRILQEQINNIIQYAFANQVVIQLKTDAEQIIFSINDNGKGSDLAEKKERPDFTNMKNRVGLFNGKISIDITGIGCSITVTVPLVKQAEISSYEVDLK